MRAAKTTFNGPSTVDLRQAAPAPPAESWWTKPRSREEFREAVRAELPRMSGDKSSAAVVRPITIG